MLEKIMDFVWENAMNVTNPNNTHEFIDVVSVCELEEFLEELFQKAKNETDNI